MNNKKEQMINELSESISWRYRRYKLLNAIQLIVMILIGIAGVFTAVAGTTKGQNQWFAEPNALLIWGSITAICAAINQFGNLARKAEDHMKIKLIYKAVKGAIEYRNLPPDIAEKIRSEARIDPEGAGDKLNEWIDPQTA